MRLLLRTSLSYAVTILFQSEFFLLGHPKTRLFISHAGLFSLLETRYHAVPVLTLPIFGDQATNAARIVQEGFAESMEVNDITEDSLRSVIVKMITDKKYVMKRIF